MDDHTRLTWIYLLKTKDAVLTVFPDFLTMIETQFKMMVKAVRSDNAPELRFTELYKKKGIVAFHSCPETPEQNSVVERKHQHILNVARALMFQSQSPVEFWGECVLTAVFIINRLPSPLLKDRSPLEILTAKKVDYSGLRVFGCLAYCATSPKQRTKFQPRSRSCVFLGYPAGYKGYKVMDLETNQIYISQNVIFHEDVFPYAKGKDNVYSDVFSDTPATENSTESTAEGFKIPIKIQDFPVDNVSPATNGSSSNATTEHTKRIPKLPSHLHDYYCNISEADTNIPYPLSAYVSYNNLSEEYKSYICAIALYPKPTSFTQAKRFGEWLEAMNK